MLNEINTFMWEELVRALTMTSGRWTDSEIRCGLMWRLTRGHGWGDWKEAEDLLGAVPTHERGTAREILRDLRTEPFVLYQRGNGYKINHDAIEQLAIYLRDECGYSEFRIEATLSHFDGFESDD